MIAHVLTYLGAGVGASILLASIIACLIGGVEYGWRVLASAVMTLFALLLAPVLPAFASNGWLPRWLWWFQTPDNPLYGDHGYQISHAWYPGVRTGWRGYLNQVGWLLRNPAYGFDWEVLAIRVMPADVVQLEGDPRTSNIPGHNGTRILRAWRGLSSAYPLLVAWEWYGIHHWPGTMLCARARFGWKIPSADQVQLGQPATFVCSFNPLMGWEE